MTLTLDYLDDLSRVRARVHGLSLEPNGTCHVQRSRNGSLWHTVRGAAELPLHNPDGLQLTGDAGDYASTPDAAALDITGDLDLRFDATLDDWNPGTEYTLVAKYTSTGDQRSYRLYIQSDGDLALAWSTDGTAGGTAFQAADAALTPAAGGRLAVRATLDVDNGASGYDVTFYTAATILGPWTQLGTVQTGGSTTSIHAGTAVLEVGSINEGALNRADGLVHAAEVYDGIDGTLVADPVFADQTAGASSFDDDAGNTWTVNGDAELVTDDWASVDDYEFFADAPNQYRALRVTPAPGLQLGGTTGGGASAPDAAALDITGDIDLRVDATLDDWTSGSVQTLISKYTGTERSYQLHIAAGDNLRLLWSPDGSTGSGESSSEDPPGVDGERLAIWATLDVDNGTSQREATFYTAADIDASWTQLGAVQTGSTTSINASTTDLWVGTNSDGQDETCTGVLHAAEVRDGRNGTLVADPVFADQTTGASSFDDDQGNTWTVQGDARILGESLEAVVTITPRLRGRVWLKSIQYPVLNTPLRVVDYTPIERPARGSVLEIVGRNVPVSTTDKRGSRRFGLTVTTELAEDERNMDLRLAVGGTMFVHIPAGSQVPGGYVRVGNTSGARTLPSRRSERRLFDLPCTVVAKPVASVVPTTLTWDTVLDTYGSWEAVWNAHGSWDEVWDQIGELDDLVVI